MFRVLQNKRIVTVVGFALALLMTAMAAGAQTHSAIPGPGSSSEPNSRSSVGSLYTNDDGGFAVKFPGAPEVKDQNVQSNGAPVVLHTFTMEQDGGKLFYEVGYSDYSFTLERSNLDGVISAQLGSLKGTIISDQSVTLNGYPGRSVTIDTGQFIFYSSVYAAGNRLYQVMFGMGKNDTMPPDARVFLNSFKILI